MRRDDPGSTSHFRTDRFFNVSDRWYFTTREGEDFGPFESKAEAESKLSEYLETQAVIHHLRGRDPALGSSGRDNAKKIAELSRDLQKRRKT